MLARQSSLNAPDRDLARFHLRVVLAAAVVVAALSLLGARFFYLQVVQHDYYTTRAEDNRISWDAGVTFYNKVTQQVAVGFAR